MYRLADDKTVTLEQVVNMWKWQECIVVGTSDNSNLIYKLTKVNQRRGNEKYAFVELQGVCWAHGSYNTIISAIKDKMTFGNIYIFENENEYAEWLIKNIEEDK